MRWMRVAGFAEIIIILVSIVFFIFRFVLESFPFLPLPLLIIFDGVLIVLLFFVYFGFVKMGRYTHSNLLRICSWISIGVVSFIFILELVGRILLDSLTRLLTEQIRNNGSLIISKMLYSLIGGLETLEIILALGLFFTIILFSVGLIKAGQKVRFAKNAGILTFINLFIGIVLFFNLGTGAMVYIALIFGYLLLAVLIFMIFSLFDASKKFENGQKQTSKRKTNK